MRPGRAADHSPPSSAAVMAEYSYNSTHPLGHTGPVTGSLYLFFFYMHLQNQSIMASGAYQSAFHTGNHFADFD